MGLIFLVIATLAGYCVIVAQLNKPPAAHAGSAATAPPTSATSLPGAAPSTTLGAQAITPGPLRAPQPGTYTVHIVKDKQASEGTLVVTADGAQRLTNGTSVRIVRLRSTTRVELVQTRDGADGVCDWTPPAVVIASKLTEGRRWSSDTGCTATTRGQVITIRRQESARVIRRARTTLGGQPVDSWLIERHVILTQRLGSAASVTEVASTELFAPSIGLDLYKISRTDVPRADGKVQSILETVELTSAARP